MIQPLRNQSLNGFSDAPAPREASPSPPPPPPVESQPMPRDVVAIDSLASRVEKARMEAEKSVQEQSVPPDSAVDTPQSGTLELEVEKHVRLARNAHQVVARYLMMAFQNDPVSASNNPLNVLA